MNHRRTQRGEVYGRWGRAPLDWGTTPTVGEVWATTNGHKSHRITYDWRVFGEAACGATLYYYDRRVGGVPSCSVCAGLE